MGLLHEEHLLLPVKLLKNLVHLSEGDQGVIFGGDEDAGAVSDVFQIFEVDVINVKPGLLLNNGLQVFHGDFEHNLWQIGPLPADFDEEVFERVEGTVQNGSLNHFFVSFQAQVP